MNSKQRALAGIIGSGLEWYDFAIYGSLASVIAALFFPNTNHFNAILATFGIFALGFFMRPLGGFIFGHFGDRIGRSHMLIFTVFGMTIPTVMIGLLPSYQQAGLWAPLLLLFARLLQGLVIGGEYTGALLFLAENEVPRKRAATASLAMLSALGGMLLGFIVATITTAFINPARLLAWAWRLPFLLSGILGVIGYYVRRYMTESEIFATLVKEARIIAKPAKHVFKYHKRAAFLAVGICVMPGIAQYLMFTFFPSFIQHNSSLPLEKILRINTLGMVVAFIVIPFFARLSDQVGRRPVLMGACIAVLISSWPIFYCLTQGNLTLIYVGILWYGVLLGWGSAPMAALYMELFPTAVRYSGIAICYNISFAVFVGTAPMLATLLVQHFKSNYAPAYLLMTAAIISFIFFAWMPETHRKNLAQH